MSAAEGGRPLPGIQVAVAGTTCGAVSDSAGRFTINNVPPGSYTVQARGIGFTSASASVSVTAGTASTVTLDYIMEEREREMYPQNPGY